MRQCCGMVIPITLILYYMLWVGLFSYLVYDLWERLFSHEKINFICFIIGSLFSSFFFERIINNPEYVSGNPSASKLWSLIVGLVFRMPLIIYGCLEDSTVQIIFIAIGCVDIVVIIASYFMYINDDQTSWCARAKPWAYPRVEK